MRVMREEIFGPVMSVLIFYYEQDAIESTSSAEFGLGADVIITFVTRTTRGRCTYIRQCLGQQLLYFAIGSAFR